MKGLVLSALAGAAFAVSAAAASAQDGGATEDAAPTFQVAERNEAGQATKVLFEGRVYDICVQEGQDSCINPRDAGLDFGARELQYWPGRPASEIDEPLPATPPAPVEEPASDTKEAFDGVFRDLNEPAAR